MHIVAVVDMADIASAAEAADIADIAGIVAVDIGQDIVNIDLDTAAAGTGQDTAEEAGHSQDMAELAVEDTLKDDFL